MYSEKITNKELAKIQPSLSFQLEVYSISSCRQFIDYTDSLINKDIYRAASKKGARAVKAITDNGTLFKSIHHRNAFFDKEVQNRILNEIHVCKHDANYWQDRYYLIKNAEGFFEVYSPLPAQKIWRKMRSDLNELELPIKFLDLKGRQQGDTTDKQGMVEHRLTFYPDSEALIASKDSDSTDKMSRKIIESLDRQPFWLRPELDSFQTGSGYRFNNGGFIDLGWGTAEYLGKGQTPTICHISEIASFKYPKSSLENALFRAMHESKWLLQFLEGTAEARDDYFHRKVKEVIAGMAAGTTAWVFNFIAWFFRRDLYPTESYIKARSEAYYNFIPDAKTLAMAKVAENSVKSWKYSREELGSNYKMDREQLFYYQLEYDQAEKEDRLSTFLSQMPTTVDEAFQHAGKTLYKLQLVNEYANKAQDSIPEVYKLKGDPSEVSSLYWPTFDEILPGGKTITIKCDWNAGIPPTTLELIQIKFDGWANFDPANKFLIWEMPNKNYSYAVSVDTSDGLGRDISDEAIINVNRIGTASSKDKQVLEFASAEIPIDSMWPFGLVAATLYSPNGTQSIVGIECNKGFGMQTAMFNRGWWNFYERLKEDALYDDETKVHKYGWWTDTRTRPAILGLFHTFFIGKHYEIKSPLLVGEVRDLQKVRRANSELGFSNDKITGKNDNRVMAAAICLFISHHREINGFEQKSWESRNAEANSIVDIKVFSGFEYEKDFTDSDTYTDEWFRDNNLEDFAILGEDEDFGFGRIL